jgi:hypothetical protein
LPTIMNPTKPSHLIYRYLRVQKTKLNNVRKTITDSLT